MTTYLLTGGTGSFGTAMLRYLLNHTDHRIVILDRSEDKILRTWHSLSNADISRVHFTIGDIRDRDTLTHAFRNVDVILHAAALKQVPLGELHAREFHKTNVLGTQNVIDAAIANNVSKVLFISSDKACQPINGYGKCKALAETLIADANARSEHTRLSSVRGGNIWASRGSVIEKWANAPLAPLGYNVTRRDKTKTYERRITVHNPATTRFHLLMRDWLEFCYRSIDFMRGGEIFIPHCDAWQLSNLAMAFQEVYPNVTMDIGSNRHGDKISEMLLSPYEVPYAKWLEWGSVIEPSPELREFWNYEAHLGGAQRISITSNNTRLMAVDELRTLIHDYSQGNSHYA